VSINDDTSYHIYILIHTISFRFQPTMKVNIHNQCSNFKLERRGYFNIGAYYNEKPAEEVDTSSMKSVDLIPFLSTFGGVLTYVLQRKDVKPSDRFESTRIRLLVVWKSEGYKKLRTFVHLIEFNKWPRWSGAKMEEYYQRYVNQLNTYIDPIKDTWLMPDSIVLMTRLELDFTQRDGILNVTISEGMSDEHTRRPEWVNLNRWVLLESKMI
jgi:hypothetical protein